MEATTTPDRDDSDITPLVRWGVNRWRSRIQPQDMEDAFQEAYLAALIACKKFDPNHPGASLSGLVIKHINDAISEWLRRSHVVCAPRGKAAPMRGAFEEPPATVDPFIDVPEDLKRIFWRRVIGETVDEIARREGITPGMVKSRLSKLRQSLR